MAKYEHAGHLAFIPHAVSSSQMLGLAIAEELEPSISPRPDRYPSEYAPQDPPRSATVTMHGPIRLDSLMEGGLIVLLARPSLSLAWGPIEAVCSQNLPGQTSSEHLLASVRSATRSRSDNAGPNSELSNLNFFSMVKSPHHSHNSSSSNPGSSQFLTYIAMEVQELQKRTSLFLQRRSSFVCLKRGRIRRKYHGFESFYQYLWAHSRSMPLPIDMQRGFYGFKSTKSGCSQRTSSSKMCPDSPIALCLVLARLSWSTRLFAIESDFLCRSESWLSTVDNVVVTYLYHRYRAAVA